MSVPGLWFQRMNEIQGGMFMLKIKRIGEQLKLFMLVCSRILSLSGD